MKWFILGLCAVALIALASSNRLPSNIKYALWTLLGFLAVQQGPLGSYFALVSWAFWPGYVKGFELSALDLLAVGFLIRHWSVRVPTFSLTYAMALYLGVVVSSAIVSREPQAGLFYAWQLGRVYLVGLAIYRGAARDEKIVYAVFNGMALAILVALLGATWDSLLGGQFQTGGAFGHQNMLGMMTHFVSLPALIAVLSGATGIIVYIAAFSGPVTAWLTVSRATLGIVVAGYCLTFLISAIRRWTGRKMVVAGLGVICVAAIAPSTIGSFQTRLARDAEIAQTVIEDEREVFERVAALMLEDHPFGIGPNHYVSAANSEGYADRAGVIPTVGSRGAHVHNAYWLVAAETGYLGLIAFVILLFKPLAQAIGNGWRSRKDPRGDLLLGFGLALAAVYFHSLYEWLLLTFQVQYMFAATAGMIAALSYQLKMEPDRKRRSRHAADSAPGS